MTKYLLLVLIVTFFFLNRVHAQINFENKLIPQDASAGDYFGSSVSISGDYAIVGALQDDNFKGSAYIFKREGTMWVQQDKITAMDGEVGDRFGWSVSMSGGYVIVGAPSRDENGPFSGSAYIFKRNGTTWTQDTKLNASDAIESALFGFSVCIDSNYAIVGAPQGPDTRNFDGGAAYLFRHHNENWEEETRLDSKDQWIGHFFGASVAIDGNYAVVGAWERLRDNQGSAYVFRRLDNGWNEQTKLTANSRANEDFFGSAVAISGEHVLVGVDMDDSNGADSGAAQVFKRDLPNLPNWISEQELLSSYAAAQLHFGRSVSLYGDYALIGAPGNSNFNAIAEVSGNSYARGSAQLFKRNGESWVYLTELTASDGSLGDQFGTSVALSGDYAIVGANQHDENGENSGSAYVYYLSIPFANDDVITTTVGTPTEIDILENDATADGSLIPSTVKLISQSIKGSISLNSESGVATYEPFPDSHGSDSFTYIVENDRGITSNVASVRIIVGTANLQITQSVKFQLFNNGVYGFDEFEETRGGFSYNGRPGRTLFSGGFIAAISQSQHAQNVIPSFDFENRSGFVRYSSANYDQVTECEFVESNSVDPIGILVKQTSISNASDDFVVFRFLISNPTRSAISNLYIGQYADWDVGDFSINKGGYDSTRALLFQFEDGENDQNYYGLRALSGASGARLQSGDLELNSVYTFISSFDGFGPNPVSISQDYRSFIGSGPYQLDSGDSVSVGFAWVAGVNLNRLQQNSDLAQKLWDKLDLSLEEVQGVNIPDQFVLEQNYPNPFNSGTTIQYGLPLDQKVTIRIYNILGQEVANLMNDEQKKAGYHTEIWDGQNDSGSPIASGIYIYQLQTDKSVLTKKMALVR